MDKNLQHFNTLITQLEGGALNEALSEEIRKVVSEISDAAMDRGGVQKGSVTLKLDFKIDQKDKIIEVQADVKTKVPQTPRGRAGMFWCDSDGNLTRENPHQMSFDDELARRRKQEEHSSAMVEHAATD